MRHLALLSMLPLMVGPLFAQQFPEIEPNDTVATAQSVALGSQTNCDLAAADQDWFRFTTPGGYMGIAVIGAIDTQLELWNAAGTACLAFNDDGQGLQSSLWMNLAAGTYNLKVDGFSATTAGVYSLEVGAPSNKPLNGSEVEPNDVLASATPVSDGAQVGGSLRAPVTSLSGVAGATNTTTLTQSTTPLTANAYADGRHWLRFTSGANAGQRRRISGNTAADITVASAFASAPVAGDAFEVLQYDSDFFRFVITAPRALVAFSITEGDNSWVSGYSWEAYDSTGTLVSAATLGTNAGDSSAYNARLTNFRVWPAGSYYVRIFERRSALTGDPLIGPANGNYRFELKVRAMNTGGTVTEPAEPNNTVATAIPIVPGQQGRGTVTNGSDSVDLWGPITVTVQTLVCFQTDAGATAPALLDSTINLRMLADPATGALLAPSTVTTGNILNTTPGSSHARGTFNLLLPGSVYYLEVASPGTAATQSGSYVLEISLLDTPTYAAGSVGVSPANSSGCGTAGVPTIGRVISTELPVLGQTFVTRTLNLNSPGNLGMMILGFSGASGPSGAPAGTPQSVYNPQPLDLAVRGAPGCTLNVNPLLIEFMVGNPATQTADYVLRIPGNPGLQGLPLFLQPAKLDLVTPVNALGIQPGNWMRLIVGTRYF